MKVNVDEPGPKLDAYFLTCTERTPSVVPTRVQTISVSVTLLNVQLLPSLGRTARFAEVLPKLVPAMLMSCPVN